jgi:hypothetical protein
VTVEIDVCHDRRIQFFAWRATWSSVVGATEGSQAGRGKEVEDSEYSVIMGFSSVKAAHFSLSGVFPFAFLVQDQPVLCGGFA